MSEPQMFFILSVKWSHRRDKLLTWFHENDSGYTFRLDGTRKAAGRYPLERVMSMLSYYHNGHNTLAVPCDLVIAASVSLSEMDSRSIDRVCLEDRVVRFSKLAQMKRAAALWREPMKEVVR